MVPLNRVLKPFVPEPLAAHVGRQVRVSCVFRRWGSKPQTCLVDNVVLDGQEVRNHLWVQRAKALKVFPLRDGDGLEFEATVERYVKTLYEPDAEGNREQAQYGLKYPRGAKLLDRPPEPPVPELTPAFLAAAEVEANGTITAGPPSAPELTMTLDDVRALKALAARLGGKDALLAAAEAVLN